MSKFISAAVLSVGLFCGVAGAATVLVNDTFTGGADINTTTYPRWNSVGSAAGVTPIAYANEGDALSVTPFIGGSGQPTPRAADRVFLRPFAATTIGVGESIQVSFDFYVPSGTAANPYRFGLYDFNQAPTDGSSSGASTAINDKKGYFAFIYSNAATNAQMRRDWVYTANTDPTSNTGMVMTSSAGGLPPSTPGGTQLTTQLASSAPIGGAPTFIGSANVAHVILTIENLGGGNNEITTEVYKGSTLIYSLSATESDAGGYTKFDTLAFLTQGVAVYDNVKIQVVPEPTVLAVGALGLMGMLARRRHRPQAI